jgi:ParB family chromosome partitioning protein
VKKTNKRLGKGLKALIPENSSIPPPKGHLTDIDVSLVKANPYQPRIEFDKTALGELKQSISEKGVIQPITVRKVESGYELIAGERRLRAIAELGLNMVPAYIIEVNSKEEMMEMAIIENVQREKLNPIEEAVAYQRLIEECNLTQEEVAQKIGKERPTISNLIRLLSLPKEVQENIKNGKISTGHAKALLAVSDNFLQKKLMKKTIEQGLSVRKLEQILKSLGEKEKPVETLKPKRSIFLQKAEEELRERLGTKVNLRPKKEGGVLEIEYYSPEDLTRLMEMFETIKN